MKFKRILAAGMAVLCSVLPLCPAASAQGDGLLLPGARKKERIMQKTEKFRQKSQFLKI